jgi:hypothetical protein
MKRLLLVLVATLGVATVGVLLWAQQPDFPAEDSGDAPDHGVARLSLINGNVSVAQGDSGDLAGAAVNAPVVAGDRVLTSEGSRAEVQFDGANLVRLAPSTEVRMGDLRYHHHQVQVAQGLVTFRVLRDNDAQLEISTPSISVRPLRQGIYRVLVRPDGTSEITVRAGEAEAFSPRASERLRAGQAMLARGSAYDPEIQTVAAYPSDDWDRWNADRDRFFERADASRYVSPDVYGTEDLAGYGHWANDPAYGWVWAPTVDPDWAPYREGRWSYIDYYGWSWVSYDPWGWAPYHYGRWYRAPFGWAWYPGPIGPRYYWRPALVGFFGWGSSGFGVGYASFGFGNVGWVPLGPREPFRPWYGRGFNGGARNFTVINNTNVVNIYQNARFTNAVTSVRAGDFGRTAVRGNNFVRASAGDLSRAGMVNGQIPFAPARESRQFGSGQINTQGMPRVNGNIGGNTGNTGNTRFFSAPAAGTGTRVQPAPVQPAPVQAAPQNGGGWRRFEQTPGGGAANVTPTRPGFNQPFSQPGSSQLGSNQPGSNQPGSNRPGFSQGGVNNSPRYGGGQNYAPSNSPREQQPVRISPPIVNNRNESGFDAPRGNGFGGPRPNGVGGGGFGPPREPQGGSGSFNAPRGNLRGGESRGGGFSAPAAPQREFRGGGGFSAPPPSQPAREFRGGGGFSAPPTPQREFRGGGGGGGFNAPRAPQGGGGGSPRGGNGGGGHNGGGRDNGRR